MILSASRICYSDSNSSMIKKDRYQIKDYLILGKTSISPSLRKDEKKYKALLHDVIQSSSASEILVLQPYSYELLQKSVLNLSSLPTSASACQTGSLNKRTLYSYSPHIVICSLDHFTAALLLEQGDNSRLTKVTLMKTLNTKWEGRKILPQKCYYILMVYWVVGVW